MCIWDCVICILDLLLEKAWGWQVPSRGPPVRNCLILLNKPFSIRATTATRTGCARHGAGHKTPFSGRGSRNAAEDPRPNILQLNIMGLTADTISVIEQLAYKNKTFIVVLQETHCTTADKLAIPSFSLVGSVLSRNHGLARSSMSGWNGHWSISLHNNQRLSGYA